MSRLGEGHDIFVLDLKMCQISSGLVSGVGAADNKMYFQNVILSSDFLGTSRVVESIRTENWALDHNKKSSKNI